jgi:hypothetical protein
VEQVSCPGFLLTGRGSPRPLVERQGIDSVLLSDRSGGMAESA